VTQFRALLSCKKHTAPRSMGTQIASFRHRPDWTFWPIGTIF